MKCGLLHILPERNGGLSPKRGSPAEDISFFILMDYEPTVSSGNTLMIPKAAIPTDYIPSLHTNDKALFRLAVIS